VPERNTDARKRFGRWQLLAKEALNKRFLSERDASAEWPSTAKAAWLAGLGGTAEAMPFPNHWRVT